MRPSLQPDPPAHPKADSDQQARHETADVGEVRDAADVRRRAQRGQAREQLQHEEEAQDHERRDLDQLEEQAEVDDREHARPREPHEVRAEHGGHRATRADERSVRR
jgi:hypothetical protein